MSRAPCLLVTGFDAFPGVPDNPTARLVRWLRDAPIGSPRARLDIVTAVLPVEWRACREQAERLFAQHDPDMALHFGAHRRATGFRIEQWARNATCIHPDARGQAADSHVVAPGAPRALRAPHAAIKIAACLNRLGLPATASPDAGRYLCNMLYFLSLDRARRGGPPGIAQFVHVPARIGARGGAAPGLTWEELRAGALATIAWLTAQKRPPGQMRDRQWPAIGTCLADSLTG